MELFYVSCELGAEFWNVIWVKSRLNSIKLYVIVVHHKVHSTLVHSTMEIKTSTIFSASSVLPHLVTPYFMLVLHRDSVSPGLMWLYRFFHYV